MVRKKTSKKDKKWVQKAIKKEGSFTEYCKKRGYKGVTQACINEAKKSKNPKTRRRAILAETLRKTSKRKR